MRSQHMQINVKKENSDQEKNQYYTSITFLPMIWNFFTYDMEYFTYEMLTSRLREKNVVHAYDENDFQKKTLIIECLKCSQFAIK